MLKWNIEIVMIVYFSEIHLSADKCLVKYTCPKKQTLIYISKVLANLSLWIFVVVLNHYNFVSEN